MADRYNIEDIGEIGGEVEINNDDEEEEVEFGINQERIEISHDEEQVAVVKEEVQDRIEEEEGEASVVNEAYLNDLKLYLSEKKFDIPESFWSNPTTKTFLESRRKKKRGARYPWYRCPWCKRVPATAMYEYVFYHMYNRNTKQSPGRTREGRGCGMMPEEHRQLNRTNQLVDRFHNRKGETREEYFFVEPEEVSPVVAVKSERIRLLSTDITPPKKPRRISPPKSQGRNVVKKQKNKIEPGGDVYNEYVDKIKKYFTEKSYDIPEKFWQDFVVTKIIEYRCENGIEANEIWCRCPWCKKTAISAIYGHVRTHMYKRHYDQKLEKYTRKGCALMPENHRQLYLDDKLVKSSIDPEEVFQKPEDLSPQMVLETEFFDRFRKDFESKEYQTTPEKSKTDKKKEETEQKDEKNEPEKSETQIDMSAGPSHE